MQGDRRQAPRTQLLTKVILVYGGSVYDGVTTDISVLGVFVKASILPAVGSLLKVDFGGKQLSGPAVRFARVIRHETGSGGIRGVGLIWVEEAEAREEMDPDSKKAPEPPSGEDVGASAEPEVEADAMPEPSRTSSPTAESVVEAPSEEENESSEEEERDEEDEQMAVRVHALEPRTSAMERWAEVYKKDRPLRFAVGDAWYLGRVYEYASDGSLSIYTHEVLPAEHDRVCLAAPHVVDRRLDVVRVLGAVKEVQSRAQGMAGGYFRVVLDRLQPL